MRKRKRETMEPHVPQSYHLDKRIETVMRKFKRSPQKLREIFIDRPRLIFSLSNFCDKHCVHCIACSDIHGKMCDFEKLSKIPEEFFRIFEYVDFGRTGDPLLYKWRKKDLADVISLLFLKGGIRHFTIAAGLILSDKSYDVIKRIKKVKEHYGLSLESMLTFHLYYPFPISHVCKAFQRSLRYLSEISEEITIAIIGDHFFTETSFLTALKTFRQNLETIFGCFQGGEKLEDDTFLLRINGKETKIEIKLNDVIYPLGRFKEYLQRKGRYEEYIKTFKVRRHLVCPDIGRWPGIVLETNGDLNLCGHFEAINNDATRVTNIFTHSYEEIEEKLLDIYQLERRWFFAHLELLRQAKVSACKLENRCYRKWYVK